MSVVCGFAVGTGNTSGSSCACGQHNPLLDVRYYELWRSEWLRDIRENTVSQMQHVLDRMEPCGARRRCLGPWRKWDVLMGLTCELAMVCSDKSAFWRVRRSSVAN